VSAATIAPGGAALITGASGGLGRAFAELFAADGWKPILVSRNAERLNVVAADLKARFNVDAPVIAADLAQPGSAQRLFDGVQALGIAVDALVNNAGFATWGLFADLPLEGEREEVMLNVVALTELSKLFLGPMLARKRGRILNVASTAAFQPGPTMATYCASKAFVLSLSEALSNEVAGSGVSVTCFCPGATATGFQARAGMADSPLVKRQPMADASSVARVGYAAMLAGKRLQIEGLLNTVMAFSPRLAPRGLVLQIGRRILGGG
jgi:uncharacterized protein